MSRDWEREAIADAAYEAWRCGRNYDAAWDRAERAVETHQPYDRYEAEEVAMCAALKRRTDREADVL